MLYPYDDFKSYTLPNLLDRSTKLYKDKDLVAKVGSSAMSYGEFFEEVQKMIKLLREYGISKGDKVLLLSENMPNWAVAYFSVTYFGGVIVPVLVDFHPSDVHHIIRHSEVKAVFTSQKYLQTIEDSTKNNIKIVIETDSLKMVDALTNKDYLQQIKQKFKEISNKVDKIEEVKEDQLSTILYTSGTTGHSKAVMLSHKNIVTNAMSAYVQINIKPDDVFLSILPLAHTLEATAGLIVPLLNGASIHYIDKAPTPSVLLKAFNIVKPTMMVSVPLIIEKIYKNKILPNFTNSFFLKTLYAIPFFRKRLNIIAGKKLLDIFGGRLRFFGIGGANLPLYVEQFLKEANFPYIIGYGLTETAPLIAGSVLGEKVKLKSTGIAMAGVEIKIVNDEIVVKSPSVMMGYYKDEEQTKEVIKDGWFYTGDLGYIDEDNFLFINGRSKNVIIGSGGENIYPEQIEATIDKNEYVLDSIVMMQNEKLVAKINLDYEKLDKILNIKKESEAREEIQKILEDMRLELNKQVSSFSKITKFIEHIEPFVKTPTKKIKRHLYQ